MKLNDGAPVNARIHKWDSIRGLDAAKQIILENIIWPIKYSHVYQVNGFGRPSGLLLKGPTGCGKTLLISSLASLPGFKVILVRGPELIAKYIGASEAAVRDVFERARRNRPAVICFDELDALAPKRGHDSTGVTDRVVNQLLTEIDGTEDRNGIFIIGTTSRPELIDPALLRSGRIEKVVEVGPPNLTERIEIFKGLYGDRLEGLHEIAELTKGWSGAEIRGLLYDAQLAEPAGCGISSKVLQDIIARNEGSKDQKMLRPAPGTRAKFA